MVKSKEKNVMNKILTAYGIIGAHLGACKVNTEQWKDEILMEWDKTKSMPRKMKKRRRKELQLDWSFACWGDELYNEILF